MHSEEKNRRARAPSASFISDFHRPGTRSIWLLLAGIGYSQTKCPPSTSPRTQGENDSIPVEQRENYSLPVDGEGWGGVLSSAPTRFGRTEQSAVFADRPSGFSLLEAVLSIVILGLIAAIVSGMYIVGIQAVDASAERTLLDGQLRSQMEELISRRFEKITDGTDTVTVQGQTYTVTWTVVNADLDADGVAEPNAKRITVTLNGLSLQTLVVDHGKEVGKI